MNNNTKRKFSGEECFGEAGGFVNHLSAMTLTHDYEEEGLLKDSHIINIYAIKDTEVQRMFRSYMESIMNIAGYSGRHPKEGGEDYGYYTYYLMSLGESTNVMLELARDKEKQGKVPVGFNDLLFEVIESGNSGEGYMRHFEDSSDMLHVAEYEMLRGISEYMSIKYGKDIEVYFDGIYLDNSYYLQTEVGDLFDEAKYNAHIKDVSGVDLADEDARPVGIVSSAEVSNSKEVDCEIVYDYGQVNDGEPSTVKTVVTKSVWNIGTGEVTTSNQMPQDPDGLDRLGLVKSSHVKFIDAEGHAVSVPMLPSDEGNGSMLRAEPKEYIVAENTKYDNEKNAKEAAIAERFARINGRGSAPSM